MKSEHQQKSSAKPKSEAESAAGGLERLQKVLAAHGIGSRRQCEELILTGRVDVDKQTIETLGVKVDPSRQEIRVDGSLLPKTRLAYYAVHKPVGIVTTNHDPAGRPRVIDLVPSGERLFPVGRLDVSSEGLIIVTNDGELANRLTHPRYGIEKTYQVLVAGSPSFEVLERMRRGIHLAEGVAQVARVAIKSQRKQSTVLEMVLDEGRNREIRRILARVGHKVLKLKRVAVGPLRLADLEPGQFRPLRKDEVRALELAVRANKSAAAKSEDGTPIAAVKPIVGKRSRGPNDRPLPARRAGARGKPFDAAGGKRKYGKPAARGNDQVARGGDRPARGGDRPARSDDRAAQPRFPRSDKTTRPALPASAKAAPPGEGMYPGSRTRGGVIGGVASPAAKPSVPTPPPAQSSTYGGSRSAAPRKPYAGGRPGGKSRKPFSAARAATTANDGDSVGAPPARSQRRGPGKYQTAESVGGGENRPRPGKPARPGKPRDFKRDVKVTGTSERRGAGRTSKVKPPAPNSDQTRAARSRRLPKPLGSTVRKGRPGRGKP